MLRLTRNTGERIRIRTPAGDIWVSVETARRGQVGLGIDAPRSMEIDREELIKDDDGNSHHEGEK